MQKRIADLSDRLVAVQMSVALSASAGGLMAGLSDDELRRLTPEELENLSDRQLHASRPIRPAVGCWSTSSWTSRLPNTTTGRTPWKRVLGWRYRSRIPERAAERVGAGRITPDVEVVVFAFDYFRRFLALLPGLRLAW